MGRKGCLSAQMAGIALWAHLMPGEWSLEYTCQVWFGSVYEQPRNSNFLKIGPRGPFVGPKGHNFTLGSVSAWGMVSRIYLSSLVRFRPQKPRNNNFKKMGRNGPFFGPKGRIALWAQLMHGEWSPEYTCQVWFGSVY